MIPRLGNDVLSALNVVNDEVSTHCNTIGIKTIRHPQFGINEINYNILNQDLIHPTFNGSVHMAKKHYRRL